MATRSSKKTSSPRSAPAKKVRAPTLTGFANGRFDARPDRLDFRDLRYAAPLRSLEPRYPQDELLAQFLPSYIKAELVLDQGQQGACTGFGLAAVINYLLWTRQIEAGQAREPVRVSPRMLYELARRYDEWPGERYEGSSCRGALKGWHKHGVCAQALWPDSGRRATPKPGWDLDAAGRPLGVYYRIERQSVLDIQAAIRQIGAVYVSAKVHDGWDAVPRLRRLPSSHAETELPTIGAQSPASATGGHAFALVGYNERGFIVQNSWGTGWGASGFAVLPYNDWVLNGTDAWAVALGVPQVQALTPERIAALRWPARSGRSLGFRDTGTCNPANPADDPWPIDREFDYPAYQPWSTAQAYEHTLVTGNNGQVVITDLEAGLDSDVGAFVDTQVAVRPLAFLQAQPRARLMIYAHGGLNSQGEAIDRIRVLAPYFAANGIYPLFLTWRTGPVETLLQMLQDKLTQAFGLTDEAARVTGFFDRLGESRDRAVEALARTAIKSVWSEMRDNARLGANAGRGLALLARSLARLQARLGPQRLELHLVGHSAGAILLGHLLGRLASVPRVPVAGCSLYAAACSVAFALRQYLDVGAAVLDPAKLHLHYLKDREEKDDDLLRLGPLTLYGKSLLYLVSRALDDDRKMPLLGLERALQAEFITTDQWAASQLDAVREWQRRFDSHNYHPVASPSVRVNRKGRTVPATHGSFDNDIDVITATIERITGAPLPHPIEWLDY